LSILIDKSLTDANIQKVFAIQIPIPVSKSI